MHYVNQSGIILLVFYNKYYYIKSVKIISTFIFATFIIVTFFTNDKIIKYTIAKVPTSSTHCKELEKPVVSTDSELEVATSKETNLPVTSGNTEKTAANVSSRAAVIENTNENVKKETPKKSNPSQTSTRNKTSFTTFRNYSAD